MAKRNDGKIECGIIMPIGAFGNYTKDFWCNLKSFLEEAIVLAGMIPVAAWEDEKNDVIHAKIIENISNLPVMIGLIVGHNPNVMLECGMRLWSNKPILLVVAENENIPFDVSNIPCLQLDTQCGYFALSKLKQEISAKLQFLVSEKYRTFKSYYTLPREIEAPLPTDKDSFADFVSEMRDAVHRISDVQAQQFREIAQLKESHLSLRMAKQPAFLRPAINPMGPTGPSPLSCECLFPPTEENRK